MTSKLFRVYYAEVVEYEDYVEAHTEDQAEEIFKNSLKASLIDPKDNYIQEFEVTETTI